MAAEITLFKPLNTGNGGFGPVFGLPMESKTTSFTADADYLMRVYANAAAVVLTINAISFTVPAGTIGAFSVNNGVAVTVA